MADQVTGCSFHQVLETAFLLTLTPGTLTGDIRGKLALALGLTIMGVVGKRDTGATDEASCSGSSCSEAFQYRNGCPS